MSVAKGTGKGLAHGGRTLRGSGTCETVAQDAVGGLLCGGVSVRRVSAGREEGRMGAFTREVHAM